MIAMGTRLNINVNDETAAAARELAAKHQTSVTEIVRRATSVYHFFGTAAARGDHIRLVDPDGTTSTVEMI